MKTSSPNMTSQIPYIRFQSRRGHFWFVFVKLSETIGFSYLEHHGFCKTQFWELILLPVGMTDVFEKYFQQKKNCPISLHLTFKVLATAYYKVGSLEISLIWDLMSRDLMRLTHKVKKYNLLHLKCLHSSVRILVPDAIF